MLKIQERGVQTTAGGNYPKYIFKYSDLRRLVGAKCDRASTMEPSGWERLPKLCKIVLGAGCSRCFCRRVLEERLPMMMKAWNEPFIFCCFAGPKIVVIPLDKQVQAAPNNGYEIEQDALLFICRSPHPHENHIERTARLSGTDFRTVAEAWLDLEPFGPDYAKKVRSYLEARSSTCNIKNEKAHKVDNLAQAYANNYMADIVLFDCLESFAFDRDAPKGKVFIDLESRNHEPISLVRLVVSPIGQNWTGDAEPIPIIGLAMEVDESRRERIACLKKLLLEDLSGNDLKRRYEFAWDRENVLKKWGATVELYSDGTIREEWASLFERRVRTSIDSGTYTTIVRLLALVKDLETRDTVKTTSQELKKLILDNVDRLPHQTPAGVTDTVFWMVFADLSECMADMNFEKQRKAGTAIGNILLTIEPYAHMPLAFKPPESFERKAYLRTDLAVGSNEYILMLANRVLIPLQLQKDGYKDETVRGCLQRNASLTVKSMLMACDIRRNWTATGRTWGIEWGIDLEKEGGWKVWDPVFKHYRGRKAYYTKAYYTKRTDSHHSEGSEGREEQVLVLEDIGDITERIDRHLFEIAGSKGAKYAVSVLAQLLLVVGKILTFGICPSPLIMRLVSAGCCRLYRRRRVNT